MRQGSRPATGWIPAVFARVGPNCDGLDAGTAVAVQTIEPVRARDWIRPATGSNANHAFMKRLVLTLVTFSFLPAPAVLAATESATTATMEQPAAAGQAVSTQPEPKGGDVSVAWNAAQAPAQGPPDFYAGQEPLRQYVLDALAHNPSIQEALGRYRAELQRVPQATSLPDPTLTFTQAIEQPQTRVGSQLNGFSLTQAYPWFGKRRLRGDVATRNASAGYQMYRARERQVIADVKQAFYNLAYADSAIGISKEEQSLLEHYEQLARTRYSTGLGLQQAVVKIQAEITKVMNRLQILGQQRETLAARLNTLRNLPPEQPVPPVAAVAAVPAVRLDLTQLYDIGERGRQELLASRELEKRDQKAIELARKDDKPDLTFGVSYSNIIGYDVVSPPMGNGDNSLMVSVGVTLPIWRKKYAADVAQASETLNAQKQGTAALANDIRFAIRDQVVRVQTLGDQIALFDKVLIPQADQALRSSESAYETGQLGVLDLLDSERTLLQVRLANARQRADYMVALTALERAIGTKFPE
jgi:cobalt-zinc-cadmium efflux system outer membrane protein